MPLQTDLTNEIEQLLIAIIAIQEELAVIYASKREAVRSARADLIDACTEKESRHVTALKAHLRHRHQILQRAQAAGEKADSLEKLVQSWGEPARGRLLGRIDQMRRLVENNQRESWVLWIVSKQSLRFFSNVLDLIANGGRKAPVYFAGPGVEMSFGGSILDASA